jgi:hypothetical protein
MRRFRSVVVAIVLVLLAQSSAIATVHYSPGPSSTHDAWSPQTQFTVQHSIDYDWQGSSGPYVRNQQLRVNIINTDGEVTCGFTKVDRSGATDTSWTDSTYPFPLNYNNTPFWWVKTHNRTMGFVSGQYVKFQMLTGHLDYNGYPFLSCNSDNQETLGGWSSTINSSNQWSHILITGF